MRLSKLNDLIEGSKTLGGHWELGNEHEIRYRGLEKDEELKLKGSLISAEPGTLVFSVDEKQKDQLTTSHLLKLSGHWRANAQNQLVFDVKRGQSDHDTLTFTGGWHVGEFQEILYSYEVQERKTRRKIGKFLVFKGAWDLDETKRLTYLLGGDSEDSFRFRGAVQTKSILAKKGEFRYQLGAEVSGRRRAQEIVLFGKWKYSDKLGLSFELEYEEGRKQAIVFGGEVSVSGDERVSVKLKSRAGDPLGIELVFTKDVFGKDGQMFARLQRWDGESRVEAGMRLRF